MTENLIQTKRGGTIEVLAPAVQRGAAGEGEGLHPPGRSVPRR
jgi:hypothetical protein